MYIYIYNGSCIHINWSTIHVQAIIYTQLSTHICVYIIFTMYELICYHREICMYVSMTVCSYIYIHVIMYTSVYTWWHHYVYVINWTCTENHIPVCILSPTHVWMNVWLCLYDHWNTCTMYIWSFSYVYINMIKHINVHDHLNLYTSSLEYVYLTTKMCIHGLIIVRPYGNQIFISNRCVCPNHPSHLLLTDLS